MLKSHGLSYRYPDAASITFPDISISEGDDLLITGSSGSGKSTLLHLLAGSLQVQTGTLELLGEDMKSKSARQRDRFRSRNIGIVLQRSHFIRSLSVQQNLLATQYAAGLGTDKKRVREICDQLNIAYKLNELPNNLSQGEQQRASIARALLNRPKLLLADEPTSSLDDQNCETVLNILQQQGKATGASLIVVTHDQRVKEKFQNQVAL